MRENPEENLTIVRVRMKLTFTRFRHRMQEPVLFKYSSDFFRRTHGSLPREKYLERVCIRVRIPFVSWHYNSDFTKPTSSGSIQEIAWPSRSGRPAYLRTTLPLWSMM